MTEQDYMLTDNEKKVMQDYQDEIDRYSRELSRDASTSFATILKVRGLDPAKFQRSDDKERIIPIPAAPVLVKE